MEFRRRIPEGYGKRNDFLVGVLKFIFICKINSCHKVSTNIFVDTWVRSQPRDISYFLSTLYLKREVLKGVTFVNLLLNESLVFTEFPRKERLPPPITVCPVGDSTDPNGDPL